MARTTKKEKMLTHEEKLAQALVPEAQQPYKVPKNWCWVRLERLYKVNPKNDADDDIEAGFVPMEKVSADMCQSFSYDVQPWIKAKKGHTQLADGDVAFAKISPCFENRKSMVVNGLPNGIGGGTTELIVLRQPMINQQFTFWLISTEDFIQGGCQTYRGVVGQQRISMEYVRNYPIPLPPLAEQQRIIERIEGLFAKLDEAKEKAQSVVDGFENRRTVIIHRAFTGELTANWRCVHVVNEESWVPLTLNDVGEYKKGPFGSSITKAMFVPKAEHTYKVYEQGNAIRKTLDYGHYYINEQKYKELKNFSVQAGDIIVSCAGTIGEVYKLPEGCEVGVINQALMRVRLYPNIDERFFVYYFGEVIKGDVIDQANGTAIKNIPPFKVMKAMEIRLPSLEEQIVIADTLDELLLKEQRAKEAAEQVIDKIDIMKKSILARAFRGELGTNDPTDEPAEELLKRVL